LTSTTISRHTADSSSSKRVRGTASDSEKERKFCNRRALKFAKKIVLHLSCTKEMHSI